MDFNGDKVYAISYLGEGEERYQQNLPAVHSIIDSFQLIDEGSPFISTRITTRDAGAGGHQSQLKSLSLNLSLR